MRCGEMEQEGRGFCDSSLLCLGLDQDRRSDPVGQDRIGYAI